MRSRPICGAVTQGSRPAPNVGQRRVARRPGRKYRGRLLDAPATQRWQVCAGRTAAAAGGAAADRRVEGHPGQARRLCPRGARRRPL